MASSGSPTQNKTGRLTYPGSSSLPIVPLKETWAYYPTTMDNFREATDKLPLMALPPFKDTQEDDK